MKKMSNIFQYIKRVARGHQLGFSIMIHIENVFIFYRLTCGFAAIKRKYTAEKYKAMYKELEDDSNLLKSRE
jgi:cell division protein FtsB